MKTERISITCNFLSEAFDQVNMLFDQYPRLEKVYLVTEARPGKTRYYVLTWSGFANSNERVMEITRCEPKITVKQARPLMDAICRRMGLSYGQDAKRIIDMANESIRRCKYIAERMILCSGDNQEYLPGLIHYYTPRYIANCIEKN